MKKTTPTISQAFKCLTFFLILIIIVAFNTSEVKAQSSVKLEQVWATDTVLQAPESVVIDSKNQVLYVSNINGSPWEIDGNGFISKLDFDGKIIDLKWVKGMNCPKGMGVFNNFLYVADADALIKIDIQKGEIVNKIAADPAFGLNDISISKEGLVYVSGSKNETIFRLENNELKVFMEDDFQRPNGLLVEKDRLLTITSGNGHFYEIDYITKNKVQLATDLGHGDGIADAGNGSYLLSDWNGQVFYMDASKKVVTLLDTREEKINAADIAYSISKNLLFVPTFYKNKVVAYRLIK